MKRLGLAFDLLLMAGCVAGLILFAIPLLLWAWTKRAQP